MPARTAIAVGLFVVLLMRTRLFFQQRLPVGDRDLVIVGMDFGEREEAVAIAAVIDERRLQRRFYARHLGEVNIASERLLAGGFEIEFFDPVTLEHDHPGFFRMGRVDNHLVGHV